MKDLNYSNNNYNDNDNFNDNYNNYKNSNNDNNSYNKKINDINYNNNINNITLTKEKKILKNYFRLIMDGESQIELTKKNLISRKDFNIISIFNLFDEQNKGYITFDELKNELEFIG